MEEMLKQLGFSDKEAKVYLALLEYGMQPASVIAKKASLPKTTVLFLFGALVERGYIRRTKRGRTQYFYADPKDLRREKEKQLLQAHKTLENLIPLLNEFKNPFSSPPKITLFEGMEGCRKAYDMLLESSTEIHEFAAHDILEKMGKEFMDEFIKKRSKKKIQLRTICEKTPLHEQFQKRNEREYRNLSFFPCGKGRLHSSIDIFENKVLLMNLFQDPFAILIESAEVAETLRVIHSLAWK